MEQYLEFAQSLAKSAAKVMNQNFGVNMAREWKEDSTPLTIADTTINALVIEEVKKRFPDHGVLGEEDRFNPKSSSLWVVDPVDGTMPFSNGIPTSVFSLALVENGNPVVAVVQDPFCNRMYYAAKGAGAFLNGSQLRVNNQSELGAKTFIEVAAKLKFRGFDGVKVLAALASKDVRASKNFSAAYYCLPVVTGKFAATVVLLEHPWDGAAIALLTTEAGGKVTDLYGKPRRWDQEGDGFVVSNGGILHDELLNILRASRT